MNLTIDSYRKQIINLAQEALKDHVITPEQTEGLVRMWSLCRPDMGIYWFRVIIAPGCIVVYGDVGDSMYNMHEHDPLPWLRDAINSPEYLIGKMITKKEKFFPAEAYKILDEMKEESQEETKVAEEIKDNWNTFDFEDSGYEFRRAIWEAGTDFEVPSSRAFDYNEDTYWSVECLKKFIKLLG